MVKRPAKVYTVYFIENLINNKFYYGVHKTHDPDDGYLGSGNWIKASVAKYGKEICRVREEAVADLLAAGWQRGKVFKQRRIRIFKCNTHGTTMCYRHGCRCLSCVDAFQTYHRDDMRRRKAAR